MPSSSTSYIGFGVPNPKPGDDPRQAVIVTAKDIVIDQNVQRAVNPDKLVKMGEFDYDLAEAITLVERTDGVLIAIEGQHRAELLKSENPDARIFAMLLPGPVDEAGVALAITKSRKAHSPFEVFSLEVAKGDPFAVAALEELDAVGVRLSNYKRQIPGDQRIAAVAAVRQVVRSQGTPEAGAELLGRTLGTIKTAFGEQTDMWASTMIKAVAGLLSRNPGVDGERLTAVLARMTPIRWLQETAHKREGQTSVECVAVAIVTEYNRGRHQVSRIAW